MENDIPGIDGKKFKLVLADRYFSNKDIIDGGMKLQVMSDPEQVKMIRRSRWRLVNWWRKITKTQKSHSTWQYTVKLID